MKKLALLILCIPILFTACKKEGCQDVNALNFDAEAEKDGNCQYTKVIFYAGSNLIGGVGLEVTKIEVFRRVLGEDELIGTLTDLEKLNDPPVGCTASEKSIVYQFTNSTQDSEGNDFPHLFVTRYYFEGGTEDNGDFYKFSTNKATECTVQNLTV